MSVLLYIKTFYFILNYVNSAETNCSTLIYETINSIPRVVNDTRGTCPGGLALRAFIEAHLTSAQNNNTVKILKEISPHPNQKFFCQRNRKCYMSIQGVGLTKNDQLTILPTDYNECPPQDINLKEEVHSGNLEVPLLLQAIAATDLMQPSNEFPISTSVLFQLPERYELMEGSHKICYSPFLSKNKDHPESKSNFYYDTGSLNLSNTVYSCDFETETSNISDENDPLLPCGLKNYRNKFIADLVWQLNQYSTETPGTGPQGDSTANLNGSGHYVYMDSPGYSEGAAAFLLTPPISFIQGRYCIKYSYHMFGVDVSSFRVYTIPIKYLSSGDRFSITLEPINSPRWVSVGNKGDLWHQGGFDFTVNDADTLIFAFEALAGHSELSDIALDDILITPGSCPSSVIHNYPKSYMSGSTVDNGQTICGEVRLITGKHSYDKAWHVKGAISCAGKGYSIDDLNNSSWVPCCVPSIGTYDVVLEDAFGDGWNGSELEFRFFNQITKFGGLNFTSGYQKDHKLVIGTAEVLKIEKLNNNNILVFAKVVFPNSYLWCGVIKSGPQGQVLSAGLNAEILRKYGVRSQIRSTNPNQILTLIIGGGNLENDTSYDLYCYAESTDKFLTDEVINAEIVSSRLRISTDKSPPEIQIKKTLSTYNTIKVDLISSESCQIWCTTENVESNDQEISNIYTLLKSSSDESKTKAIQAIKKTGTLTQIISDKIAETSLTIVNLLANTKYRLLCYAEDTATPLPNSVSVSDILNSVQYVTTAVKVPSVKVIKRTTEFKGFRLVIKTDAPGRVWCVATNIDYGTPTFEEIEKNGVSELIKSPEKEHVISIRGVHQNTVYKIYCAAALVNSLGEIDKVSSDKEIENSAIEVTSYGRYCDIENTEYNTVVSEKTPFHPITPDEELLVRDYVQNRSDLELQGIYRITLLYNKTEIYKYYEANGPKPFRFARVRAGRCSGNLGYYEQYKVGPLEKPSEMQHSRLARPVETVCGGYNPQGVFGRNLEKVSSFTKELNQFFFKQYGYSFGESCNSKHFHKCIHLGPLLIEDNIDKSPDLTRIWIGFVNPNKERLKFYILYNFNNKLNLVEKKNILDFVRKLIDFDDISLFNDLEFHGFWFNENIYNSIDDIIKKSIPSTLYKAHNLRELQSRTPFVGAAGTAGPLPRRQNRRTGLEYKVPPEHVEPQGKRFTVQACDTHEEFTINYLGWSMIVNNDRDTALKLYNLRFLDKRVAFEVGLMEALAHYTVSERNWFFLDSWYGGLGSAARRVHKGIECPKTGLSLFFDGSLCVFEQDMARPIRAHWKSGEIRDGAPHLALVLRQMVTVSNYDYVTDYVFHATGMFQSSVSFTGELYAGIEVPWYSARQKDYGVQVTGAMRFAAIHNHMAVWKVDLDVGVGENWKKNSVLLTEVIPDDNRHGALKLKRTLVDTEMEAALFTNDTRQMSYTVVDEMTQTYGNLGGYQIIPGPSINPLSHDFDLYQGPAAWAKYRIAASVYKPGELDSTLPRDNKFADKPAVSLDRYVMDNDMIRNSDVVTWISDGIFHIPVVEDMPLTIPIGNTLGWLIKPSNLHFEDPSMDLHNAMGGGVKDPGTCAVVRLEIGEVEPSLQGVWKSVDTVQ